MSPTLTVVKQGVEKHIYMGLVLSEKLPLTSPLHEEAQNERAYGKGGPDTQPS